VAALLLARSRVFLFSIKNERALTEQCSPQGRFPSALCLPLESIGDLNDRRWSFLLPQSRFVYRSPGSYNPLGPCRPLRSRRFRGSLCSARLHIDSLCLKDLRQHRRAVTVSSKEKLRGVEAQSVCDLYENAVRGMSHAVFHRPHKCVRETQPACELDSRLFAARPL
jgi:hypothetical protein